VRRSTLRSLGLLGGLSLLPYMAALQLNDLRTHTVEFEIAFFAAFTLYALAVVIVLRADGPAGPRVLVMIVGFAVAFRLLLVFSTPTLTDDMYRYVWDGRVQAHGINPYLLPPDAPALAPLRDDAIWPSINRKSVVTVYPGGAQLAFAALWRIMPDNVRWFQLAMTGGGLAAGLLLMRLLRALGQPAQRALLYLWSPLPVFETAHAAHVDGLVLPVLVAAWLARARGRDALVGVLLGAAVSLKLYPVVLFPVLWRVRDDRGRRRAAWVMPVAFVTVLVATYLPYLSLGVGVIGFLPTYFTERFNPSLARLITDLPYGTDGTSDRLATVLLLVAELAVGVVCLLRPARNAAHAIRRSIWPIGVFVLLTQILYPWYVLWLVPLLALFVRPGRFGLRLDAWTGSWLFSGLVMLSYTWYITMSGIGWTSYAQFGPLFALLFLHSWRDLRRRGLDILRFGGMRLDRNRPTRLLDSGSDGIRGG